MSRAVHARATAWRRSVAAVATMLVFSTGCSSDAAKPSAPAPGPAASAATGSERPSAPLAKAESAAAPAPPAEPDGSREDVPSSIDHSCGSDVTTALEDFFRTVADNSTVVFPSGACYRLDGTLTIDNHRRLAIDGNGSTLKAGAAGDRDRRHVVLSGCDDVTVRGLTVIGSNDQPGTYNAKLAFQHAFTLSAVRRVLLENVSASRLHGDFVYIGSSSSDVTVRTSVFDGSGRQGISVTSADRVLIADNDISNAARSMFDIEPNNERDQVRDVRITGNRTGTAVNFWLANKGAGDNVTRIELDNNTMNEATGGLVFAFGHADAARGPYVVRDNQFIANNAVHDENSVGAFLFSNCHDVSITGNRVTFAPGVEMPVVELRSSRSVTVAGNDFSGAAQPILSDATTSGLSTSS